MGLVERNGAAKPVASLEVLNNHAAITPRTRAIFFQHITTERGRAARQELCALARRKEFLSLSRARTYGMMKLNVPNWVATLFSDPPKWLPAPKGSGVCICRGK